jgi:ribosome maturation factor RimP
MIAKQDIDKRRIEAVVDPICRAHGVELVEVAYAREPGGAVLRILIDRDRSMTDENGVPVPGSAVTLDDCKAVSRDLGTALDVNEDALPNSRYRLEVGSPGLDRPLVKPADFERFAGALVKLQTRAEVPGAEPERRKFSGVLRGLAPVAGVAEHRVRLEDSTPHGPRTLEIPFDAIQKANLVPAFSGAGATKAPKAKHR